jgi:hypothetical protein
MALPKALDSGLYLISGTWDDLPTLFDRHQYPYKVLGSSLSICQDRSILQGCRALYIACGADCEMTDQAAHNIRQFVANGGGLYVSDMASAAVERIFPGQVIFNKVDYLSDNTVRVVDPGLAAQLGSTITLHMDYQNAQGIQSTAPGVQVLLCGPRQEYDQQEVPYLVVFQHGQGQVVYTVFHNLHQVDDTEEKLLRYLILRPLLTRLIQQAVQALQDHQAAPLMEILSTVDAEQSGETYIVPVAQPGSLWASLSWEGHASFSIAFSSPAGKRVQYFSADHSPILVQIPAAKPGHWRCTVKGIRIPQGNFPYLLLVGKGL